MSIKMRVRKNSRLDCDPILVAERFAASNFSNPIDRNNAQLIIQAYRLGQYELGKKRGEEFAVPEFGNAVIYFLKKQFVAIMAKCPFPSNAATRKSTALKSFYGAERKCGRTNKRLRHFQVHPNRMSDDMRICLSRAREWVRRVLGRLDDTVLDRVIGLSRPGGGVAIGTRNRYRVSLPFKLGDTDLVCTQEALPYALRLVEGSPAWLQLVAEVDWPSSTYTVPYIIAHNNKITFVPKDARTLRTIAIEPALNVCLQLGVHSYLQRRLEQFGFNILDQSRNQDLAKAGSLRSLGSTVATLDLSAASDTLSIELVRMLLPSDWFGLLDDLRCKSGVVDGTTLDYNKFSSMGNGFTFALETLIFASLCVAANSVSGGDSSSVYGDDIIIPDKSALLLTELLKFSGFDVNLSKSYYHGPFRESCGADWHSGLRVTPQYIRKHRLRCTDVYNFLNRVDPLFNWSMVRDYLLTEHSKKEPILFGLVNEDSASCLFSTFDYVRGAGLLKWNAYWQNWTYRCWAFKPASEKVPALTAYAAALKGSSGSDSRYQLRGLGEFRLVRCTPGVSRGIPTFG
jgi:hypothetical protein